MQNNLRHIANENEATMTPMLRRIPPVILCAATCAFFTGRPAAADRPNFVLVMTDDQGWGEMGYYNHPVLETPNLDKMAASGLRFDRFYAAGPNCSSTRASVLTGRQHMRTGVISHSWGLRPQEITIAKILADNGYQTAHFGKWHLDGLRGPGMPIPKHDLRTPGKFGFTRWVSATNYIDVDPAMADQGEPKMYKGDSSDIIVDEALKFMKECKDTPFLAVVWYGSPHSPHRALPEDLKAYEDKSKTPAYYAELRAVDRSVGTLRKGLRDLGIAENTVVWFNSDNGGIVNPERPATNGGLRGQKHQLYEGGIRVPGIIEWPAGIKNARVTRYPACTLDIAPTLLELAGIENTVAKERPMDGMSLKSLIEGAANERRATPIPFYHKSQVAWINNDFKLLRPGDKDDFVLYHLTDDPGETTDIKDKHPEIYDTMVRQMNEWLKGVDKSIAGGDYPEGKLTVPDRGDVFWGEIEEYATFARKYGVKVKVRKDKGKGKKDKGE